MTCLFMNILCVNIYIIFCHKQLSCTAFYFHNKLNIYVISCLKKNLNPVMRRDVFMFHDAYGIYPAYITTHVSSKVESDYYIALMLRP